MTTTTLPTEADYQQLLQQRALAEYQDWARRLEMERWTTSGQDPDQALRELVRREGVHTTHNAIRRNLRAGA